MSGAARGGERGAGLVEVLITVAVAAIALVVFLAAISTGSVAVATAEERVTAENLARSQLEYTKSQAYQSLPATYATVTPPTGYALSLQAEAIVEGDGTIQRITVTVTHDGANVIVVEAYKVNR